MYEFFAFVFFVLLFFDKAPHSFIVRHLTAPKCAEFIADLVSAMDIDNDEGEMTRVDHSDGSALLAWLSISGQSSRQALDDDGLDEILTCLVFMLFPPVVETALL